MSIRSLTGCAAALSLALVFAAPGRAQQGTSETTSSPGSDGTVSASAASGPPAAPSGELVDGIAAQVGTEVVLVSEVERVAKPIEGEDSRAGRRPTKTSRCCAPMCSTS